MALPTPVWQPEGGPSFTMCMKSLTRVICRPPERNILQCMLKFGIPMMICSESKVVPIHAGACMADADAKIINGSRGPDESCTESLLRGLTRYKEVLGVA